MIQTLIRIKCDTCDNDLMLEHVNHTQAREIAQAKDWKVYFDKVLCCWREICPGCVRALQKSVERWD